MEELLAQYLGGRQRCGGRFCQRLERTITLFFGSSNARYLKKLQPQVAAINALEPKYHAMSDGELREQTETFRQPAGRGRNAR